MNKYNVGDFVFVINWDNQYRKVASSKLVFKWNHKVPDYSSTDYFVKCIYEDNLTLKGTINKREPKKLVRREYPWKNFKYEILEFQYHLKAGELSWEYNGEKHYHSDKPIYLIRSEEGCYVEISEESLSLLTPEQYKDEKFNALKEFHKGKWSINASNEELKTFPKELLGKIYDKNDKVLFGISMTKGKICYEYIPAEYTVDNIPFIIQSGCTYDGIGNSDLPKGTEFIAWNELPKRFPNNTFK